MAATNRIGPKRLGVTLLLLSGCQQQPGGAFDRMAQARDACQAGVQEACQLLGNDTHDGLSRSARLTPETYAEQVQRDVAAIIRGMRQTSASNGL